MRYRIVSAAQYACLAVGTLLVSMVALARLDAETGRSAAIAQFAVSTADPDQSLWSPERVKDYRSSLSQVTETPVAILRIPELGLEVPVYASDTELHLNRGAGLIAGIEVETRLRRHVYRVVSTEVVDASAVHVLADSTLPTVTLVTCYPFYFLGHAPQRFIVRGAYEWT
jgi:sortase A